MASDTTTQSAEIQTLLDKRDAAIAAYDAANESEEAARTKADKKAAQSASAKKANHSRRIGELELDLTLEGVSFTPWEKPKATTSTRMTPLTQAELEATIAKVTRIYQAKGTPESVRHAADVRLTALLKSAAKRGYEIADPRK